MKMVSAGKLRRAQEAQNRAKDYAHEVNNLIYRIAESTSRGCTLLTPRQEAKSVLLLVFSSDKGLCGGFNNNLIKFVVQSAELTAEGKDVSLSSVRRGTCTANRERCGKTTPELPQHRIPVMRQKLPLNLKKHSVWGIDEIHMVYNHFVSPLSQEPQIDQLIPLPLGTLEDHDAASDAVRADDFITEPGLAELLDNLIPRLVVFKVFFSLLENSAGEHGARMTAMDNATTNAGNLIDEYTLLRNRARQAAITTELIEIISGAEAL